MKHIERIQKLDAIYQELKATNGVAPFLLYKMLDVIDDMRETQRRYDIRSRAALLGRGLTPKITVDAEGRIYGGVQP
jgi:hypothetical protein